MLSNQTTVVRIPSSSIEDDSEIKSEMCCYTAETGNRIVRVWRPQKQVAFGLRDANAAGYERAHEYARAAGFQPVVRSAGGRAVAFTGSTVAFARCHPTDDMRQGLQRRYETMLEDATRALRTLDIYPQPGEPDYSFCPGTHSLQAKGKLVGIAQRITNGVALVSGLVVVRDHRAIASVLDSIYDWLDVPFDPETVGSVANAGGTDDPGPVMQAFETALTDGSIEIVDDITAINTK